MKITNLKSMIVLGIGVMALSACSTAPAATPPATRAPTQTPWLIYVSVTSTPEPAVATVLPMATTSGPAKPTATQTKAAVKSSSAPKAVPTATVAPVVAAKSPTTAPPACSASPVTTTFPEAGTIRKTKRSGPASDTFDFKFATPSLQGETDPQMGYHIEIFSKVGNKILNGDVVDVQHNFFWNNGQHYVYDAQRIWGLGTGAPGDMVGVTWTVTVIKATGGFDNKGRASGTVVDCSPPSTPSLINLSILDAGS